MNLHYTRGGAWVHLTGARLTTRGGWPVCGFDLQVGTTRAHEVTCRRCLAFMAAWVRDV